MLVRSIINMFMAFLLVLTPVEFSRVFAAEDTLAPELALTREDFYQKFDLGYAILSHRVINDHIRNYLISETGSGTPSDIDLMSLQSRIEKTDISLQARKEEIRVLIVSVPDLLRNTGQLGHIGFRTWNNIPVIYLDKNFFFEQACLEQGLKMVSRIEKKRRQTGKTYEDLRAALKTDGKLRGDFGELGMVSQGMRDVFARIAKNSSDPHGRYFVDRRSVYESYMDLVRSGAAGLEEEDKDLNLAVAPDRRMSEMAEELETISEGYHQKMNFMDNIELAVNSICGRPDFYPPLKKMLSRLVSDQVPFCSTMGIGVPLASEAAAYNNEPPDAYLKVLETIAREMYQRGIDPYQTLLEAEKHFGVFKRNIRSADDFEKYVRACSRLCGFYKSIRDLGYTDLFMRDEISKLLKGIRVAKLDDIENIIDLESRLIGSVNLSRVKLESKQVGKAACAEIHQKLPELKKQYPDMIQGEHAYVLEAENYEDWDGGGRMLRWLINYVKYRVVDNPSPGSVALKIRRKVDMIAQENYNYVPQFLGSSSFSGAIERLLGMEGQQLARELTRLTGEKIEVHEKVDEPEKVALEKAPQQRGLKYPDPRREDLELDEYDRKNYYWDENTRFWTSEKIPGLVLGTVEDFDFSPMHERTMVAVRMKEGFTVYLVNDHLYSYLSIKEAQERGEVSRKDNRRIFIDDHMDDYEGMKYPGLEGTVEEALQYEKKLTTACFSTALIGDGSISEDHKVSRNYYRTEGHSSERGAYSEVRRISKAPELPERRYYHNKKTGQDVPNTLAVFDNYFKNPERPRGRVILEIDSDVSEDAEETIEFLGRLKDDGVDPSVIVVACGREAVSEAGFVEHGSPEAVRQIASNLPFAPGLSGYRDDEDRKKDDGQKTTQEASKNRLSPGEVLSIIRGNKDLMRGALGEEGLTNKDILLRVPDEKKVDPDEVMRQLSALQDMGIIETRSGNRIGFSSVMTDKDRSVNYTATLINVVTDLRETVSRIFSQRLLFSESLSEADLRSVRELVKLRVANYLHTQMNAQEKSFKINIWDGYASPAQEAFLGEIRRVFQKSDYDISFSPIDALVSSAAHPENINDRTVTILPFDKLEEEQINKLRDFRSPVIFVNLENYELNPYSLVQIEALIAAGKAYLHDNEESFYNLYELLTGADEYERIALDRLKENPSLFIKALKFILKPIIAHNYEELVFLDRRMREFLTSA